MQDARSTADEKTSNGSFGEGSCERSERYAVATLSIR